MKRVISFLQYRMIAIGLSVSMAIVFTVITVMNGGLNFGIDFVGGVKIISQFEAGVDDAKIRSALKDFNPMVQQIGDDKKNEYIISTKLNVSEVADITPEHVKAPEKKDENKTKEVNDLNKKTGDTKKVVTDKNLNNLKETPSNNELTEIKEILSKEFNNVQLLSVENVGPAIGDFLKKSAVKLFAIALLLMVVYLSFRFEFKYSVGAIAALVHDIFLSIAFCGMAGVEINIPVIAALLTIFGYSVNDSIVIFDRIRENVQVKSKQTFLDIINKSISQSISRTLLTSLTTLFAVLSLYLLGGAVLNEFAMVLLFGIFVGTYSSVYIASPVLLAWESFVSK